jgi:dCTP deaminase
MKNPSSILTSDRMLERLERGELLYPGTWTKDNIRAAAYDVRIADDFLIVPEDGYPHGRRYKKGEHRTKPVILQPGEVAFLSTRERICIPWDVCANIGIKFGYARQGILVLTGLLVDPGFGLMPTSDGKWIQKTDERIHFLLANVGSNTVVINPGRDKLVSIQFFEVQEPSVKKYVPSGEDMEAEFFGEKSTNEPGLAFFRHMTTAMTEIKGIRERLDSVERGTQQLVYFGVFLLSTSVIAASISYTLASLSSEPLTKKLELIFQAMPSHWPQVFSFGVTAICVITVVHLVLKYAATATTAFFMRHKRS